MWTCFPKKWLVIKLTVLFTGNPPLSPLEGLFISSPFEGRGGGGLIETGGGYLRGVLISLRKDDDISSP